MGVFDSSVTQVYGSAGVYGSSILDWVQVGSSEAGAQSLYSWSTHQLMRGALSELHWSDAFLQSERNVLKCKLETRCVAPARRSAHCILTPPTSASLSPILTHLTLVPYLCPPPSLAMHPQLHLSLQLHLH